MSQQDYFDDVPEILGGLGGLFEGSEGLGELHKVKHRMDPGGTGFVYSMQCENCGRNVNIGVTWLELVQCANKKLPIDPRSRQPWRYDAHQGGCCPPVGCGGCRRPLMILFYPDECEKRVHEGIQSQKVNVQWVQQVSQQLARQR
jgi:hypothetical protein